MRHGKESSGKQPERWTGSGKAEASEFEPREFQESPSQEVRDANSSENQSLDLHGVSDRNWKQIARATDEGPMMYSQEATKRCSNLTHWETRAKRRIFKLSPQLETDCEERCQSFRDAEARIPKYADLRSRVLGERLQELQETCDPCRRCTTCVDRRVQDQHIDVENVYVGINEGRDSYGTKLQ